MTENTEALLFAEWIGYNYVRLHNCWVHKYADQRNKDNWKQTSYLYEIWINRKRLALT